LQNKLRKLVIAVTPNPPIGSTNDALLF